MPLSKERVGEIAMKVLQHKLEQDGGVKMNPSTIAEQITVSAEQYGITPAEAAEFAEIILRSVFDRTMAEIESLKQRTAN